MKHTQLFYSCNSRVPKQTLTIASGSCIKVDNFTGPERASCAFWLEESKPVTTEHRDFLAKYAKYPPSRRKTNEWQKCFLGKTL